MKQKVFFINFVNKNFFFGRWGSDFNRCGRSFNAIDDPYYHEDEILKATEASLFDKKVKNYYLLCSV